MTRSERSVGGVIGGVSSEDPRYYEHGGVDLVGTTRALLANLEGGAAIQGGSISQQ